MPDQVWRIDDVQSLDSQEVVNSYHVRSANALTNAQAQVFVTGVVEKFIAQQGSVLRHEYVNLRRVDITGTQGRQFQPTAWPKVGAQAVDVIPGPMGVLVKGTSIDGVSPGRVKKFIAGIIESHTTAGKIAAGSQATWQTVVDNIQAYIDAATDPVWVCVKYSTGADPHVTSWNDVFVLTLSTVLCVQRRRKIGVGR